MGKEKSSESESYSGSGQMWARGYAKQGIGRVMNTYDQAQPTLDRAVKGTSDLASALQNKFASSATGASAAGGYWNDVLGGNYLNGNPHLDSIIAHATQGARDGVNSNYAGAGRYGSTAHDKAVASEVGNLERQLRYGDYNNERGRMDAAAAAATGANQGDAAQALGAYGQQAQIPYTGSNALAQQLSALFSGGNQKSTTYAPSPIWGAVGAGLGAAGAYFSDERLKKDVETLRVRSDGLPVKSWIYKNDPELRRYEGFVAQDVQRVYPEAVIENFNGTGFLGVNYASVPHETKLAA